MGLWIFLFAGRSLVKPAYIYGFSTRSLYMFNLYDYSCFIGVKTVSDNITNLEFVEVSVHEYTLMWLFHFVKVLFDFIVPIRSKFN